MRRFLWIPMMLCLILVGCGKPSKKMQEALDFRSAVLKAGGCAFSADITIQYPEKTYGFSMDCRITEDEAGVTVTAPEAIAGIAADIHGGDCELEFQDVRLEFGKLANGYVAPLAVPWILGSAWRDDYISAAGMDGNRLRITCLKGYNDEELTIDTWFENDIPVYAEISHDGVRVLQVTIKEFVYG